MQSLRDLLFQYRKPLILGICGIFVVGAVAIIRSGESAVEQKLPESPISEANEIIRINSKAYSLDDIVFLRGQRDGNELSIDALVEDIIDQNLLASRAKELELEKLPDQARRLEWMTNRILADAMIKEHVKDNVNEDSIRNLYEAQKKIARPVYETRARQILVPDAETADQVLSRLDDGDNFATLAFAYSIDRVSRENGGDMGYFTGDMLGAEVTTAAFNTDVGARAVKFQSERGWHILEVTDRRLRPVPSYEDMREELEIFLKNQVVQDLVESLRTQSTIYIDEEGLEPLSSVKPNAKEGISE